MNRYDEIDMNPVRGNFQSVSPAPERMSVFTSGRGPELDGKMVGVRSGETSQDAMLRAIREVMPQEYQEALKANKLPEFLKAVTPTFQKMMGAQRPSGNMPQRALPSLSETLQGVSLDDIENDDSRYGYPEVDSLY